jgi:hypothetical protein
MSDYLDSEKSRWSEDEADEPIPAKYLSSQFTPSDSISEEYYKLLDVGCSIANLLDPASDARAKFIKEDLMPVWGKWKARVGRFTSLIEEFEERLMDAGNEDNAVDE